MSARRPADEPAVVRERRERLRRERDRRRTLEESSRPARTTQPAQAKRKRRPERPHASTATRERHEGLVSWFGRSMRVLPSTVVAGTIAFGREVAHILLAALRVALKPLPGSQRLFDRRGRGSTVVVARTATPRPRSRPAPAGRAVRSLGARRNVRIVAAVILIGMLLVAWWRLPSAEVFRVDQVEVVGASAVSDLDVRLALDDVLTDTTILKVDTDAIIRRVEALPFVRSAEVHRHFPGGLEIRIAEYEPLALGIADGGPWLVARDGRILAKGRRSDWEGRIPTVVLGDGKLRPGSRVDDEPALQVLTNMPPDSTLVFDLIKLASGRSLVGRLDSGVEIRLGRYRSVSDLRAKLLVAQVQVAQAHLRKEKLIYIDVSVPARPAYCHEGDKRCAIPFVAAVVPKVDPRTGITAPVPLANPAEVAGAAENDAKPGVASDSTP